MAIAEPCGSVRLRYFVAALLIGVVVLATPKNGHGQDPGLDPGGLAPGVLHRVFPGATGFGALQGAPPAMPVWRDDELVGYVFRSHAVVQSLGLSGKTLDILAGLDTSGRITGAAILEHHEPILAIGVSGTDLENFVAEFAGRDVRVPVRVLRRPGRAADTVAAVSGATVSSLLISDAILQSARAIGHSRGILESDSAGIDLTGFEETGWDDLIADGSIETLTLTQHEAEIPPLLERGGSLYGGKAGAGEKSALFIELHAGLATPARIGRNLLGARAFNRLTTGLTPGDHLIFLAANGRYSFKGTAYVQTGRFDRIQIAQGSNTVFFQREDHVRIDRLKIDGVPDFREMAVFRIPAASDFDAARPWRLELIVEGDGAAGPLFTVHDLKYDIPARYLSAPDSPGQSVASPELWREVWRNRIPDIVILGAMLAILGAVFFLQDVVARRPRLYRLLRRGLLAVTLFWLGWYATAQLSVLNVLTFAGAVRTEFRWDFFLLEPLIFVLWSFVAVALLFGGRGAYCGWLCPFGALQELLNSAAQRLRLPQIRVPFALHERLWPLKYIVFLGLFAVSLGSIDLAWSGAEVEPFKTAIVMHFLRAWPFLLYVAALLTVGLFIERAFCRYLCPLGAALAIPARIRMFEWLKRRWHCGRHCNICAQRCPVQAIHPDGRINPNECIYCLNCQTLYFDDTVCPPLIERRKRRETWAGAREANDAT